MLEGSVGQFWIPSLLTGRTPERTGVIPRAADHASMANITALYGEDIGEEVGEHSECDEPDADTQQDPSAPAFDCGCSCLECVDGALLGSADDQGEREHQDDDHERGDAESDECRGGSAGDEGLPGQTGQDRTRSTEPRGKVGEPEQTESQQLRLPLCSAFSTLAPQKTL